MAAIYLLAVAASLVVLVAALCRRPAPTPPKAPHSPGALPSCGAEAEAAVILAAAARLAAQLTPAA
jgi:hypothetical protein